MRCVLFHFLVVCVFISLGARALTGSGVSPVAPLDTVSPTLDSAAAEADAGVSVVFSKSMREPGVLDAGNYAVSGLGVGTLAPAPSVVSGGPDAVALDWATGEMRDGVALTLTVSSVQDVLGNPINPAASSASFSGVGTAPVFSNLQVTPAQASAGDTVTITFRVSEPLQTDPEVTVNGEAATRVGGKAVDYTYAYEVQETDSAGMAAIHVTGADLAGNVGALSEETALEILHSMPGLPVSGWRWPAALLLALGLLALTRRRLTLECGSPASAFAVLSRCGWGRTRTASSHPEQESQSASAACALQNVRWFKTLALLYVVYALACSSAFAQGPSVTNVTMTQSPTATSTQVEIYYDLLAPNGPCDITVSLSKDGGNDGYPHPVTSITGDIAGVEEGPDKHIVWDIRADYPEEDLPQACVLVVADDGIVQYTLTYLAGANGSISGPTPQTVNHGASGAQVIAVPGIGYHFVQWSDGVLTASRTDVNVTGPISVTAEFAIDLYPVTIIVPGELHGTCSADPAWVEFMGTSDITIIPDEGYHLVSVMDSEEGPKTGSYTTTHIIAPRTITVVFAINQYAVDFQTDGTAGATLDGDVNQTVDHGGDATAVTALEPASHEFVRWTLDGVEFATTPSITVTNVTSAMTLTAEYVLKTYTLTYLAGANGSISGPTPQAVHHGADGAAVTAVGDGAYVFNQWSDGSIQNPRTDTDVTENITVTASFVNVPPVVTAFVINNDDVSTDNRAVTLNNTTTNGPTEYMASESATFTGATWQPYAAAPAFSLHDGTAITRTVYFKARNGFGESGVGSDTIYLEPDRVSVPAGTFTMGRRDDGDDGAYGGSAELPRHDVTLSAYQLGKYQVTNQQYCDVLNWALAQGYLYSDTSGTPWTGTGNIYAGGTSTSRYLIVSFTSTDCNIQYVGGVFVPKTRTGLPGTTTYSMAEHPMVRVSWYGSVAFSNWLSQMLGLTPCYDMGTALWPLTVAPPTAGGYRLPTEAEWERAAAWGETSPGSGVYKHWIYGFMSDTLTGNARATYNWNNPLGLTSNPRTSPVGWFNGENESPNGPVATVDSPSPVGAYDMSGNVWEWCHDWYLGTYYTSGGPPWNDPTGPGTGSSRVLRGGSWYYNFFHCRSAQRYNSAPAYTSLDIGFRVSRTP